MQGTKHSGHQWNTILNLVLSSLGFVKHFIDHDLYTLKKIYTKDILIVWCSTYDFMCAYSRIHLLKDFLTGIKITSL